MRLPEMRGLAYVKLQLTVSDSGLVQLPALSALPMTSKHNDVGA